MLAIRRCTGEEGLGRRLRPRRGVAAHIARATRRGPRVPTQAEAAIYPANVANASKPTGHTEDPCSVKKRHPRDPPSPTAGKTRD